MGKMEHPVDISLLPNPTRARRKEVPSEEVMNAVTLRRSRWGKGEREKAATFDRGPAALFRMHRSGFTKRGKLRKGTIPRETGRKKLILTFRSF